MLYIGPSKLFQCGFKKIQRKYTKYGRQKSRRNVHYIGHTHTYTHVLPHRLTKKGFCVGELNKIWNYQKNKGETGDTLKLF